MSRIFFGLTCLVISLFANLPAFAAGLESISNAEAASGLKQALTDGSAAAVAKLGSPGGFLENPKVRIPLPPALQKIESALRFTGMKRQADELVLEVPDAELERVRTELPKLMTGVAELAVPLVVEVGVGENWDQAH
jgi:hypothetical protein